MEKNMMFKGFAKKIMSRSEMPVLIAVLSLGLIFAITSSNFLSAYNIYNISRSAALYVFIALSQAMVMIVSGMNLSIGFIGGLSIVAVGRYYSQPYKKRRFCHPWQTRVLNTSKFSTYGKGLSVSLALYKD